MLLINWWIPMVPPLLSIVGSGVVITGYIAHLEEEFKKSKEFLHSVINTIPDPVYVKDKQHHWIVLNEAYCRLIGCSLDDLLERSERDFLPKQQADVLREQDDLMFKSATEHEVEETFTDINGTVYSIATKRSLHQDAAGNLFLVGIIRDITRRKQIEEELRRTAAELVRSNAELKETENQLRRIAYHDPLTGLPNRKLLHERLAQAIEWAAQTQQLIAILFLDLDGFKLINDTEGHLMGDLLLKAVAQRLTGCLRSSDTVARLGGDEFVVILPAIPSVQHIDRVAQKILNTLSQSFAIEGKTIAMTTSIGISMYPDSGTSVEDLIANADKAMYSAKEFGKNHYVFARAVDAIAEISGEGLACK
ncbi:MAG: diguanylate cyclase domain-containing protein [Elainellaceae cyanobacterium]